MRPPLQLREGRITFYVEHPVLIEPPAEAPPPPPQPLKLTKRVGGARAGGKHQPLCFGAAAAGVATPAGMPVRCALGRVCRLRRHGSAWVPCLPCCPPLAQELKKQPPSLKG